MARVGMSSSGWTDNDVNFHSRELYQNIVFFLRDGAQRSLGVGNTRVPEGILSLGNGSAKKTYKSASQNRTKIWLTALRHNVQPVQPILWTVHRTPRDNAFTLPRRPAPQRAMTPPITARVNAAGGPIPRAEYEATEPYQHDPQPTPQQSKTLPSTAQRNPFLRELARLPLVVGCLPPNLLVVTLLQMQWHPP